MKRALVEISGIKLEAAIASRGMTMQYVSEELGYNPSFIANCKNRNLINKAVIVGLQSCFGIPLDEYKAEEPPAIVKALEADSEEKLQAITVEPIDYDRLWKLVYTATLEAMKKAYEIVKEGVQNE